MYLQFRQSAHGSRGKGEGAGWGRSGVVSMVKFGQEVGRARCLGLVEVTHHVRFLLPDLDGLLKLHFTLRRRKRHMTVRGQKTSPSLSHTRFIKYELH